MNERSFYFPDRLVEVAETSGIDEASSRIIESRYAEKDKDFIYNPYFFDIDEEVNAADRNAHVDVFRSHAAGYLSLSIQERYEADRTLTVLRDPAGEWIPLSSKLIESDRLFPVIKHIGKFACDPTDSITLSGAGSFSFIEAGLDVFENYTEYGFKTKLDFMVFAGACLAERTYRTEPGNEAAWQFASHRPDGSVQRTILGGNIHGDFGLRQEIASDCGSRTPLGKLVDFCPIETRGVAAYHSTETAIATAICAHILKQNVAPADKFLALQTPLMEYTENDQQQGARSYADFGDRDSGNGAALDLVSMLQGNTDVLARIFVSPTNQELRLHITSNPAGINLHVSDRPPVTYLNEELPNLLKAFTDLGSVSSRTSERSITNVLEIARDAVLANTLVGDETIADTITNQAEDKRTHSH